MQTKHTHSHHSEPSITHIWERFNARWLVAGAIAGILAGIVMMAVASSVAASHLGEWSQSFKLIGSAYLGQDGYEGTVIGVNGTTFYFGILIHFALCTLYGITFAQLVDEHSKGASLIVLGLVTSFIIWIFGNKLFMPSFNLVLANSLPIMFGLWLHLIFGLSFGIFLKITRSVLLR